MAVERIANKTKSCISVQGEILEVVDLFVYLGIMEQIKGIWVLRQPSKKEESYSPLLWES
jgi:hypothetical protein